MFNITIQKFIATLIALSMAVAGISTIPTLAFADNGFHLGLGASVKAHTHTQGKVNKDNDNEANEQADSSLNIQDDMFVSANAAARTAFNQAVKSANTTFKTAKQTAKTTLVAAVKVAPDQASKTADIKAYFTAILDAFKVKAAAIEAAFQTFINAGFTTNQVPVANAQAVTLHQNTSANITLTGSDPEGATLSYAIVNGAGHGTLSGTAPNLTYTPTANFTGNDNFTFNVNDGTQNSATATVS
ncbi:MAG: Ig-like domain-containing protein, partial [Candidatus Paceibacterales bacterium]